MTAVAKGFLERGIATLRYQFPYMERGSKRPDTPKVAQATVRAAVEEAGRLLPGTPLKELLDMSADWMDGILVSTK
jgi:predicted alpha/beta-hydrolase family hydrolase